MDIESLHLVCSLCKCFGHHTWDCTLHKQKEPLQETTDGGTSGGAPTVNPQVARDMVKGDPAVIDARISNSNLEGRKFGDENEWVEVKK